MMQAAGGLLANRYEIEALLGRGGMGEVFRARDRSLGETVALKSLLLDGPDAADTLRRFREEVRLARRVTHRNVARVFDLVEDDGGRVFLTMELIDGPTLKAVLDDEATVSFARAARIGIDVCAGLSAVHAAGIIHRDLKPTNILVEPDRAVLTDFGVARNTRDPTSLGLGAIVGTPSYMAPEQAAGRAVDFRADVYALGVTLFEIFLGRAGPHDRAGRIQNASIDDELKAVLLACVATDPGARPTPARVAETLERASKRAPRREEPTDSDVVRAAPTLDSSRPRVEPTLASSRPRAETALVVLPFREIGTVQNDLGEVVAQELTDVLSATSGLRVLAASAAGRFRGDRDPLRIGRELSVHAVIDGSLRIAGDDMRMSVRLIDAADGSQRWAETFSGSLGDLFSFEGVVAKRVAEQLRATVALIGFEGAAPAEAVRCYLDARLASKTPLGLAESLRLLERAVELAPALGPAVAALAGASLVAWFIPASLSGVDWEEACARRVARALEVAPNLPETHVADGVFAWERGRGSDAATSFHRALRLAPTCAEALAHLGELYCRVGRTSAGLSLSRQAFALDPTRFTAAVVLAREEAFAGRHAEARAWLDKLGDMYAPPAFILRVRSAAWAGDDAQVRACIGRLSADADSGAATAYAEVIARAFLGAADADSLDRLANTLLALKRSPRLCSEVHVVGVEVHAHAGRREAALGYLSRLTGIGAFVDIDWLDRCPVLAPLRDAPEFLEARKTVAERARFVRA